MTFTREQAERFLADGYEHNLTGEGGVVVSVSDGSAYFGNGLRLWLRKPGGSRWSKGPWFVPESKPEDIAGWIDQCRKPAPKSDPVEENPGHDR